MTDKQIIIDGCDVSGCELYRNDNGVFAPDGTAERTELCYLTNDYCANNPNCYYKQLKCKEQECERLKNELSTYGATGICETCTEKSVLKCDQLEEENRSLKRQLKFEFDETLLQYSNTIEDLQKQLNNTVIQKCPQCGEVYLNPVGCELHEENRQLKAENKTQKETIDGFLTILDKLGKSNIKLREILTEIKEIAMGIMDDDLEESSAYCDANRILQKIIDLEV